MMSQPLISIVIPMYNAQRFIEETLYSAMNQTYVNWEIIVVDNCSTDNSVQTVENIQNNKIKIIRLDHNSGGPAQPRNIGVENANGEYIAFLDADDIWTIDKLELQLQAMQDGGYHFSSTSLSMIDAKSKDLKSKYKLLGFFQKKASKKSICDLIKNRFIATSSVMVEKKLLVPFSEDKDLVAVEDMYVWLRLLDNPALKYMYIDNHSLKYRILSTSTSERHIKYKQESKANLCTLHFIVETNNFQYVPCFYRQIMKTMMINFIKNILGR